MTHPVQYLAPWFRYLHAHADIDFAVVYATELTKGQQGVGFDHAFAWDLPLREGYDSTVVRPAAAGISVASDAFFGLDVPELAAAVRRLQPDVVMVPGWQSLSLARGIYQLRRAGIPLLYRGDTHLGTVSTEWPRASRLRARVMLRQFSGYLAVGTRAREYLHAMGVADPSIVMSPHAVDNDRFIQHAQQAAPHRHEIRARFGLAADRDAVLYAGKLIAVKRPDVVVRAVAHLPRAVAWFVGDGAERSRLEQLARACGVTAVFSGFLNQRDIADAYVAADALLVPGKETWGLVANEALASGLPVVMAATVGASADLAHAGVSARVDDDDPAQYAEALRAVIADRQAGTSTASDCQRVVDRCSFAAATSGLVTAARFAHRNRQPAAANAAARVIALCGNFVFAGGMERNTFEALAAIQRGGADVHVLVNGWSSRPIAERAERIGATWQVGHYDAPLDGVLRQPLRMLRALGDVVAASLHLLHLLRTRRATHVFAADFRAVLLHAPALVLCRVAGVPVILRSGVAPTPAPMHERLWRWVIAPLVARHVPNSKYIARELQNVGIASERITTIANIPPRRDTPSRTASRQHGRIAYVGQVIPEKGVAQLLDAVGLLVNRGYDLTLDVVGQIDGWAPETLQAYRRRLRERTSEADLAGRVRFVGWREDIDEVLHAACLHCCPSQPEQREGFGTTVIEAKRAGIPSVVCPSGGLPELIDHGVDGWIARGFDAAAIAEGLEWLLADTGRLARAQEEAVRSARRFDPLVFEQRWQEQFDLRARNIDDSEAPARLVDARGVTR